MRQTAEDILQTQERTVTADEPEPEADAVPDEPQPEVGASQLGPIVVDHHEHPRCLRHPTVRAALAQEETKSLKCPVSQRPAA